jgi:hypothetical protein
MAVSINYSKEIHGKPITFENCYVKVVSAFTTKEYCVAHVIVYIDSQKSDAVSELRYQFPPNMNDGSANNIKQAYLHIKTLPEFEGAIDC